MPDMYAAAHLFEHVATATNLPTTVQWTFSSLELAQLAWALPRDSIRLYVYPTFTTIPLTFVQNGPSWMIVDSNEIPGGLASTDVTKEGFVCTGTSIEKRKRC